MTQTTLFTLGTAPAGWIPLARDLLHRSPPGVDLCLRTFTEWHRRAEAAAAAAGLPLAAWVKALPEDDAMRTELARVADDVKGSWGGLEPSACWTLPLLSILFPRATYLVLVESPVMALAAEMLAHADFDPDEVLNRWSASAHAILRHLQAHPGRCLVFEAAEVVVDRGQVAQVCRERMGIALRDPDETAPAPAHPEPLALYLAGLMASHHAVSAAVFAELQAACLPLGTETATPQAAPDLKAAAVHLRLLTTAHRNLERLALERVAVEEALGKACAERDAARSDAAEVLQRQHAQQEQLAGVMLAQQAAARQQEALESELGQLRESLVQANAALAAGRTEASGLKAELELARRSLQTASETEDALRGKLMAAEVSRETAHRHRDESRVAQADLSAALQRLEQERGDLQAALDQTRRQVESTRTELQQSHDQRSAIGKALEQVQQQLQQRLHAEQSQAARREEETRLLLARLHDAHGEAARLQMALRTLDERLPYAAAARGAGLDLGPVRMGALRDTPPHRELGFELPHCRRPGQPPAPLALRLVEHNGNPGLVLFADGAPPLMAWQESSREGDRPLSLFVPADEDSRQRLARLSGSDWLLLQALMSALERSLRAAGEAAPPGWLLVLMRLRSAIDALPERPRHDGIEFSAAASAPGSSTVDGLNMRLRGVDCAGLRQARWGLTWWPASGGGDIEWQLGEGGCSDPVLVSWPLQPDGRPSERLRIATNGEGPRASRRQRWLALPAQDLRMLRAVTAAMPDWVDAAASSGAVPAERALTWRASAQTLARRIDTDLQLPLSRRLARALRGTLR